ncbi:C2H2-type zinc finger-containing protein [Heterostelium album PN500]|uniref:C2H2-type zinc finger-containing protein n=1 Tax=Heterostelium pallidum (strain ATCC 26659 / Pp 5 / PN500) TaxID=670386 RepID=D3BLC2_HETP5|nr:C2H2-type zinc finger-containing protein [Heterostelium album PN500]EFA77856.1 C2H2-type zinc finger-containing protein [Heterostelium album PN500]|eukprot:XP_020429984.1 C2H2-type zinc finger-containing protein [Heterostelium album PN500]
MSSTLLERTRELHESIERYELMIVAEQSEEPKTQKDSVIQSHCVNHYLEQSIKCANDLKKIYQDEDGQRKADLSAISGQGPAIFSNFYDKLRELKDYHRKYPTLEIERIGSVLNYTPTLSFSGNEAYGRFLDLNEMFELYLNLPFVQKNIDYITYLSLFSKFNYNDISRFKNAKYKQYLDKLYQYLASFMERSQPMFDMKSMNESNEKEFEDKWNNKEFDPSADNNNNNKSDSNGHNNNNNNNSNNNDNKNEETTADESMDTKETTTAATATATATTDDTSSPLYCKACKKLFASENVYNGHLKGKKHIKLEELLQKSQSENGGLVIDMVAFNHKSRKPTSLLEYQISKLGELLDDQVQETKESVIKKQSRSIKEIEDDMNTIENEIDDIEIDDEPIKLRIANYPVDWSGKPIPYWVYKFHELGVEYKCEICGNQSYWGRKAYEKHFQEPRHSYGMSCIGIPNTLHFHHITKIKDAMELNKKIKEINASVSFKSDKDEEYEDENGEVMNKKTYEMLARQGLIKKRKAN